jgi:hypothetical protein
MLRFAVIFLLNYTWLIASIEIMKWLYVGSKFSTIALQLLPSNLLIAVFFLPETMAHRYLTWLLDYFFSISNS